MIFQTILKLYFIQHYHAAFLCHFQTMNTSNLGTQQLTYWGLLMNICISELCQHWCQGITQTNADLLSIGPLKTNYSKIVTKILQYSEYNFPKMNSAWQELRASSTNQSYPGNFLCSSWKQTAQDFSELQWMSGEKVALRNYAPMMTRRVSMAHYHDIYNNALRDKSPSVNP